MHENIKYTNTGSFSKDVLQCEAPVLVDFYSEDCAPCAFLAPLYERFADRYGNRLRFTKVFRQENRDLALSYGVKSSPTILFFKDGREAGERLSGFIKKSELRHAVEKLLDLEAAEVEKPVYNYELIILGCGPAGLTSAIFAGRAKVNTIVLDEGLPGGQASNTYHIANYPGTKGVARGRELMDNMVQQAGFFGAKIEDFREIVKVDLQGNLKSVTTEDAVYQAPAIILATGAQPRKLPVPEEATWRGRGVHYCATCDGSMYEGTKVIVVGGGNSAVEEAVFLTRYASKVTVIHEFDHLQATRGAQEEAFKHPKIEFVWESHASSIHGDSQMEGLWIKKLRTGEKLFIPAKGVFVYIGAKPETSLYTGQVLMDPAGYIMADENMKTNLPGVFAAGDIRVKTVRQVVTATGDGAVAAIQAERYLSTLSKN